MAVSTLAQLAANAIVVAGQYALMALGFILIYRVTRVFHFAHGITFVLGPYLVYWMHPSAGVSFVLAGIASVALCGGFGLAVNELVYDPLRRRAVGGVGVLIASLAVYLVCQNAISMSFGDETQVITASPFAFRSRLDFHGVRITSAQMLGVGVALGCVIVVSQVLGRCAIGRRWRACAEDRELAAVRGIDARRATREVFVVGSLLAALAGICVSIDVDVAPTRGAQAVIIAFVVYVTAGKMSSLRVVVASVIVAGAESVGGWFLGAQWEGTVAFVLLILVLVARAAAHRNRPRLRTI